MGLPPDTAFSDVGQILERVRMSNELKGKAALVTRDLGGRNITVNVVRPRAVPTDMMADVLVKPSRPRRSSTCTPSAVSRLNEVAALAAFWRSQAAAP
jgi:NAD(P)-dependent dehydrogenase (short-subunit alcohol dehydrogenase family)